MNISNKDIIENNGENVILYIKEIEVMYYELL